MLVTMKALLDRANEENYAVAAPNVSYELDARAVIEAAEDLRAPLILDVCPACSIDMPFFVSYLVRMAEQASVPIAINLDHGASFEEAIMAIRCGCSSIMVDRSALPYEENVAEVRELVKIAHAVGVSVEAEIGRVGDATQYSRDRNVGLTDADEASRYIRDTGIDCLAIAIGTAHGTYSGTPYLDYGVLEKIKSATGFPLVLHGGSGSGDENLARACRMGINKVNMYTDLMRAACDNIAGEDLTGNGCYKLWSIIMEGFKKRISELIVICGSDGKAWISGTNGLLRREASKKSV